MTLVSPSLLSADFSKLAGEIAALGNVERLHVDVMDGHFVPNITFGPPVVKSIRGTTDKILEVHLMIEDPMHYGPIFADAGGDLIIVHQEVCSLEQFKELGAVLHEKGKKIGITSRPGTDVSLVLPYVPHTDFVLVMGVEPGFGGQKFLEDTPDRIRAMRAAIDESDRDILLEIDGGINGETAPLAVDAGVDILVSGNFIFSSENYGEAIQKLSGK